MSELTVVILAAGKGTRMNSKRQKILHDVGGKPMVQHVYEAAASVSGTAPVMIVGPDETGVQELFGEAARYAIQRERLGTGHAVQMAKPTLTGESKQVIVLYGDMPLVRRESLAKIAKQQKESGAAVVLLTIMHEVTSTFGRILRNEDGNVVEICEVANAKRRENADEILNTREQNPGIYCFDADFLWNNIEDLPLRQARKGHEYYLTDMIEVAVQQGLVVEAIATDDVSEGLGAGTRAEMVDVERAFRQRAINLHLEAGVTIVDPASTYIDQDVVIGRDTVVWPNTYIQGDTVIGEDCVIGPNSVIRSAEIGNGCIIEQSSIENLIIDADTWIPPFTHAYPEDIIEEDSQSEQ